jgi:glyoxylate reductase
LENIFLSNYCGNRIAVRDRFSIRRDVSFDTEVFLRPMVDNMALYEALRDGKIAYAALDVTEPEPIPKDHPLLTLNNVIIAPPIASASMATRTKMALMTADNLIAGLMGEMPPNPVNPEVFSKAN